MILTPSPPQNLHANKRGPKPKAAEQRRKYRIGIHFNKEELLLLEEALGEPGLAQWVMGDVASNARLKGVNGHLRERLLQTRGRGRSPHWRSETFTELVNLGADIRQLAQRVSLNGGTLKLADTVVKSIRQISIALLKFQPAPVGHAEDPDELKLTFQTASDSVKATVIEEIDHIQAELAQIAVTLDANDFNNLNAELVTAVVADLLRMPILLQTVRDQLRNAVPHSNECESLFAF